MEKIEKQIGLYISVEWNRHGVLIRRINDHLKTKNTGTIYHSKTLAQSRSFYGIPTDLKHYDADSLVGLLYA